MESVHTQHTTRQVECTHLQYCWAGTAYHSVKRMLLFRRMPRLPCWLSLQRFYFVHSGLGSPNTANNISFLFCCNTHSPLCQIQFALKPGDMNPAACCASVRLGCQVDSVNPALIDRLNSRRDAGTCAHLRSGGGGGEGVGGGRGGGQDAEASTARGGNFLTRH